MSVTASAVDWLLASDEPGIVAQAKRDLLDEHAPVEAADVLDGPKVRALLAGQQADGGFGVNVYAKWAGAHWRLVSAKPAAPAPATKVRLPPMSTAALTLSSLSIFSIPSRIPSGTPGLRALTGGLLMVMMAMPLSMVS